MPRKKQFLSILQTLVVTRFLLLVELRKIAILAKIQINGICRDRAEHATGDSCTTTPRPATTPREILLSADSARSSHFSQGTDQETKIIIMMKLALSALLAGTAAAFAPAQVGQSSTALNAFESELGAQPPLGFFDPLGLLEDADQEKFDRLRYVEVKHGRICQLAFLGQIVTRNGIHLPGNIDYAGNSFDSFPNGLAAVFGPDAIPQAGLIQIFLFVGFLELGVMKDVTGEAEFPGDFRNGALDFGWDTFDEETKLSKRAIELNNGRAAMMGILGLMVHEKLNEIDMVADLPIIGALQ